MYAPKNIIWRMSGFLMLWSEMIFECACLNVDGYKYVHGNFKFT